MISEDRIKPYEAFVEPYYAAKDSVHDFLHIKRIIDRLGMLLDGISQPIDIEKLCFLACFHGLGKLLSSNSRFKEQVQTFLKGLRWTDEDIEDVFERLARHLNDPQSMEEKIVHDANYIEILDTVADPLMDSTARLSHLSISVDKHSRKRFHGKIGRILPEIARNPGTGLVSLPAALKICSFLKDAPLSR